MVYVSDAAHYSNMRLADLQNLDMVLVPSDINGCMIPQELDKALIDDRPALMIYAMGTTFKGGVDDQDAFRSPCPTRFISGGLPKRSWKNMFWPLIMMRDLAAICPIS